MTSSVNEKNDVVNLEDVNEANQQNKHEQERISTTKKKISKSSSQKEKPPKNSKVSEISSHKRKNASPRWDHYAKTSDPDFAECIYCHKLIGCNPSNGTTYLANHTMKCKLLPANLDKKQKILNFKSQTIVNKDGTTETITVSRPWIFNQEASRSALARMLIMDELPFMFVEREGFRLFYKSMHPKFAIPSRFTAAKDCYTIFIEEKRKLKDCFKKLSSRICLTIDAWTSGQNLSYMCLTAHFIDDNWSLHRKVISFCPIAGHSGQIIGRAVEKCLNEWEIKNILIVTVDNASSNGVALDYLRRRLNHWESGVLDGKFLHMRCAAHVLNLVVKDDLTDLDISVVKARTFVKYVRSSPARLQKFKASVEEEKLDNKSLVCLDIKTRWNSTYLMLESALKFKKAFANLILKYSTLLKEMRKVGGDMTTEEWKQVSTFLPFLKVFYDATLKLSGSFYVTSNYYIDSIFGVGYVLSQHLQHEDEIVRQMAIKMKFKYDKYWGNIDKISRDILVIPVSSVALESAFSRGGRVFDSFRTSLTPRMVEAVICAQDWLRTSNQPFIIEESLLQLETLEEGLENLTLEQPLILIDETVDDI